MDLAAQAVAIDSATLVTLGCRLAAVPEAPLALEVAVLDVEVADVPLDVV